ncbi:hypothetical protein BGX33_010842 [Mortierella sp. NVP41]|nr:hypothetical protein BGX33_010842 [Mortierella sp. NVP41]
MPGFKYCHTNRWLLKHRDERSSYTARPLHQLLCESPSLRHLKTLTMPYMPSFMDIHRRLGVYSPEYQHQLEQGLLSPDVSGNWVCRELESLHVDLHSHGDGQSQVLFQSRVTCGYVARVCPRLRNLQISDPRMCISHNDQDYYIGFPHSCILEGGLCLLSRLKYLELLRIEYRAVECEISEISWMCRLGRIAEHRAQRRAIVDEWASMIENESFMEAYRLETITGVSDILGDGSG